MSSSPLTQIKDPTLLKTDALIYSIGELLKRLLEQRGTPKPYDEVLRELNERDYNDSRRAAAPLRAAEDAIVVDTSALDFDASREALLALIRERLQ